MHLKSVVLLLIILIVAFPATPISATSDAQSTTRISYGEVDYGEITSSTTSVYYEFKGSEGDVVTITMKRSGSSGGKNLKPALSLTDPSPSDTTTAFLVDSSSKEYVIYRHVLRESGTYKIRATRRDNTTGKYVLELDRDESTKSISCGKTVSGKISKNDPMDQYVLDARRKAIEITMERDGSGLKPQVYALSWDDTYWSPVSAKGSKVAETRRYGLGDKVLIIATRQGDIDGSSTGSYRLTVTCYDT